MLMPKVRPPLDRAEFLLLVGLLLPAGTVYLLWPAFTLAYLGLVFVLAGVLSDLGRPRPPRPPGLGPNGESDGRRRQGR